jgi:hypothetical protein
MPRPCLGRGQPVLLDNRPTLAELASEPDLVIEQLRGPAGADCVAWYSRDHRYRYLLTRSWDSGLPAVTFLMLNPSTATAETDDNTVRRCRGYASAWGMGELIVVNLFAWRATDPRELRRVDDPVGPRNDDVLRAACRPGRLVVAAWGVHGRTRNRAAEVMALLSGVDLSCLEITAPGQPRHPLFCLADVTPRAYSSRRPAAGFVPAWFAASSSLDAADNGPEARLEPEL